MAKRRTKGDGGLFQRADGMWIGRVEVPTTDGKRRRLQVSSRNFDTAAAELRKLRAKVDEGRIPTTGTTTVTKWLDHWLGTIRGPHIGPAMYRHYEQAVRLYITPALGKKRLDRLTAEDVRAMLAEIQETSTRNAQKAHQALQTALDDAVTEGVVGRNVVDAVRTPGHNKAETQPLTFDAALHVLNTARSFCDEMWTARWIAAFLTGARPAELRGLRWSYVDLDSGLMELAWQLQRLPRQHGCGGTCGRKRAWACPQSKWKVRPGFEMQPCHRSLAFTRPKTTAGIRVVPILPPVDAALRALRDVDGANPHGLVFHHPDGRPLSQEDEGKAWRVLADKAGLEGVTQYVARHTTSTLLLKAGVSEQVRMKIIGHSSVAAQRMYAHIDHSLSRDGMAALAALVPELPHDENRIPVL